MKSMNLPGLDCRPSKKLNSGTLLHHSFETANAKRKGLFDYSVIALRDLNFSRCPASGVCGKKKDSDEYMLCIQHDDMDQLLAAMKEVDGILVATPVCLSLSSDLFSACWQTRGNHSNGNGGGICHLAQWAGPCGHILSDAWGLEQGEEKTVCRGCEIVELVKAGRETTGMERTTMCFFHTSGNRSVSEKEQEKRFLR